MLLNTFFYKIMVVENYSFSFSQFWRTLMRKLMERPVIFISYFQSSFQIVNVCQVLHFQYFFKKIDSSFNLISFFSLSTTFARKLMKRPTNFMTYFQISYHYLHAHKIWSSKNFH